MNQPSEIIGGEAGSARTDRLRHRALRGSSGVVESDDNPANWDKELDYNAPRVRGNIQVPTLSTPNSREISLERQALSLGDIEGRAGEQ